MRQFSYYLPVRILFGSGKLRSLGESVKNLGSKALLLMDPYLERIETGERVTSAVKKSSIDTVIYTNIRPDPTYTLVDEAAQVAREEDCDVLIAVGGGSTIDAAKGAAVIATNPGKCQDYVTTQGLSPPNLGASPLPIIAVPTTVGSGAEFAPAAVLTDPKSKEKKLLVSELIFPKVALIDPELTFSMPPELTAFTGIDVLSHAIESYVNISCYPYLELLDLEAIRVFCYPESSCCRC